MTKEKVEAWMEQDEAIEKLERESERKISEGFSGGIDV